MTTPEDGAAPGAGSAGGGGDEGQRHGDLVAPSVTAAEPMDREAARNLTDRIRIEFSNFASAFVRLRESLVTAYHGQAWVALGHPSWEVYLRVEFDAALTPGLSVEDRRQMVSWLSEHGLSTRAIAPVVGAGRSTVSRDLAAGVPDGTREEVVGRDGKAYPARWADPDEYLRYLTTRKRQAAQNDTGPRRVRSKLVGVEQVLRRVHFDAQQPVLAWSQEWRESIAKVLDVIAGLAEDAARLVRDPSATSLITDEDLRKLLDDESDGEGVIDP